MSRHFHPHTNTSSTTFHNTGFIYFIQMHICYSYTTTFHLNTNSSSAFNVIESGIHAHNIMLSTWLVNPTLKLDITCLLLVQKSTFKVRNLWKLWVISLSQSINSIYIWYIILFEFFELVTQSFNSLMQFAIQLHRERMLYSLKQIKLNICVSSWNSLNHKTMMIVWVNNSYYCYLYRRSGNYSKTSHDVPFNTFKV